MSFRFGDTKLVLDQAALTALLTSEAGPVGRHLLSIGVKIEGEAKVLLSNQLVNVVTGRLRSGTTHVLAKARGGQLALYVGSGADYAIYVHAKRPYLFIAAEKVTGRRFS
jgi:hypothetical protein